MSLESSSSVPSISSQDFPLVYQYANTSAERRRKRYRGIVLVISATSFLVALIASLTNSRWGIAVAAGLTLSQVTTVIALSNSKWNHAWYVSRALAESAKSLTWRFAVGADPFPKTVPLSVAKSELSRAISELIPLTVESQNAVAVLDTSADELRTFSDLRQRDLDVRRRAYLDHRLHNQLEWYGAKARVLSRQRLVVNVGMILSSLLAAGSSVLLLVEPSLFGPSLIACLMTLPPGLLAISQSLNLHSDVSAYRLTNAEIERILLLEPPSNEIDWASWVDDKEEVISREHVLWLASRSTFNGV